MTRISAPLHRLCTVQYSTHTRSAARFLKSTLPPLFMRCSPHRRESNNEHSVRASRSISSHLISFHFRSLSPFACPHITAAHSIYSSAQHPANTQEAFMYCTVRVSNRIVQSTSGRNQFVKIASDVNCLSESTTRIYSMRGASSGRRL